MRKTYFILTNLKAKEKLNAQFLKGEFQKIFDENHGKFDLILGSKRRLYSITPKEVNELKRSEKLGKFKIKKYVEEKKKYEKLVNRIFVLTKNLPENYAFEDLSYLLYNEKHRLKLLVPPITQEILYYDWKCKMLLNNSNISKNDELIRKYLGLRTEKIQVLNNEYLKLINSLKNNSIIILDEIHYNLTDLYTSNEKKIISNDINVNLESVLISEIHNFKQKT